MAAVAPVLESPAISVEFIEDVEYMLGKSSVVLGARQFGLGVS